MSQKESYLVRMNPAVINALKKWAEDELRSVNGQVEYLIRDALRKDGRLPKPGQETKN